MTEPPPPPLHPAAPYAAFDAVALAASTGGLPALAAVLGVLPADFPAPILVVQHRAADWGDRLPAYLARRTALRVVPMQDGELLEPATVYVAPAQRQAVIVDGLTASFGPARRCRADELFASLAAVTGARTIGAVLTGRLDDGAAGAQAIKALGGRVLVQDRATSEEFGMPAAAIATGCVDLVLPLERIGHALVSLVMWPGAADLLRVPPAPWARLDAGRGSPVVRANHRPGALRTARLA